MLSAFDFDISGCAQIRTVDRMDNRAERAGDAIVLKGSPHDRLAGYFRVDPRLALTERYRYLAIEYHDHGRGAWFVDYDHHERNMGELHSWHTSVKVTLNDTDNWLKVAFDLRNPRWTGSLESADFRIVVVNHSSPVFKIRSLTLTSDPPDSLILSDSYSPTPAASSHLARFKYVRPSASLSLRLPPTEVLTASIVIPIVDRLDYTKECLRGIMEFTPPMYEVIVVDNGSKDGSAEYIRNVPGLRVVTHTTNLGFAKACNAGAATARGEWLVFLNNDTIPQPGWLTAMVAAAERNLNVGVVGSRLIYPQTGTIQHAGVSFGCSRLPQHDYEHVDADNEAVNVDREVDAATGACFLTGRERFLALGGFDTAFVNGFEDIDYCLRIRQKGRKVLYCSKSTLLHYKSVSSHRVDDKVDKANIELFRQKWDKFIIGDLHRAMPEHAGRPPQRRLDQAGSAVSTRVFRKEHLPVHLAMHPQVVLSQTGSQSGGMITCRAGRHARGHCVYGGFMEIGEPLHARAEFLLAVSRTTGQGGAVVTLDVYDCAGDETLVRGVVVDPGEDRPLSRCALEFAASTGQILEFRVLWHGDCDLVVAGIDVISASAGTT